MEALLLLRLYTFLALEFTFHELEGILPHIFKYTSLWECIHTVRSINDSNYCSTVTKT